MISQDLVCSFDLNSSERLQGSQSGWALRGSHGTMDKTEALSMSSRGNDRLPASPHQEAQDALRGPQRVSVQAEAVLASCQ